MNLAPTDHELELAARAQAAFAHDGMPPSSSSFTDLCIVTRESGRTAPDRTFFLLAWARLLGWRGGPDVTVALDPVGGTADHVPRAGGVSTALVAATDGWVAELDLGTAARTPQPTIDDPLAARVAFDPSTLGDRRDHDVAATIPLATILLAADCIGAAQSCPRRVARGGRRSAPSSVGWWPTSRWSVTAAPTWPSPSPAAGTSCWTRLPPSTGATTAMPSPCGPPGPRCSQSEHARLVTVDALRLAGGRGILEDGPWARPYRRVKAAEPILGSPRQHRAAVARASLARWR